MNKQLQRRASPHHVFTYDHETDPPTYQSALGKAMEETQRLELAQQNIKLVKGPSRGNIRILSVLKVPHTGPAKRKRF